ncbi:MULTISPECIES: homoserine kinase [Prochlorococcus]|uniref:Homoserine kinase n=1 Tax=Prochlorococcus marinus (strain SARG / CCMP1375 / SS120) TaxID=167539 RepID=KHSE_PROMA|nr:MULTISPECIES: homoserine kinase [Prochlorococcus]Q7VBM6.1 RecName: Full=Homoserine kinase; Short=HK; Short=HSK [Prochlorococcus marinus subsp. marinus str. CCMP1375]AAQ00111.1 Homoserine kinase [Prochlorococcus marinus subsp. marinus str. CCMP1375]KGG13907.1 Homoserine kinase [Prochlorococcus marinus str. LG]KGG19040.1 Homoserine kinase [Prochlorococcus marinus str. SS2]KGG23420.1 Homoserine kinase [Prochlorococcus marinus str. SS35]KGG32344.1 Homoserine kinase [Prochlorococcus marinus str
MIQPPIGKKVLVEVPSTTANLGPGFDCLGAALSLTNFFTIKRIDGDSERFELIMESTEGNHLRGGPENLFYRAAQRVWKAAEVEPFALEARVKLAVPPARGLGSSATAIVAGLVGANALINDPLSKEKLLELAIDIEGHPDNVVPSLLGGLCFTAKAASQRWRVVKCDWDDSIKAVVAIPSLRLSTSEARRVMPKTVPLGDAVMNLGSLTLLLNGLRTGRQDLITDGMHDRLHEPYRWKLIKGGAQVCEAAINAGAFGCAISGAGPSILALCKEDKGRNISQAMVKAWESEGVASRAPLLNLQTKGSTWYSNQSK